VPVRIIEAAGARLAVVDRWTGGTLRSGIGGSSRCQGPGRRLASLVGAACVRRRAETRTRSGHVQGTDHVCASLCKCEHSRSLGSASAQVRAHIRRWGGWGSNPRPTDYESGGASPTGANSCQRFHSSAGQGRLTCHHVRSRTDADQGVRAHSVHRRWCSSISNCSATPGDGEPPVHLGRMLVHDRRMRRWVRGSGSASV